MSVPISTTKFLIGQSPYGDIKAKVEYTTEKITLTLSYKDLAEVLIKSIFLSVKAVRVSPEGRRQLL